MVKKFIMILIVITMAFMLFGCNKKTSKDDKTIKDGKYQSTQAGMNDNISIEVEILEGKIKEVSILNENETPGIGSFLKDFDGKNLSFGGKTPIEAIGQRIVENQSLDVDLCTGATITSYAIKAGVEDCLKQANANLENWHKKVEAEKPKDITGDVVIIGAGGAGLAAAVSASEKGANVILIEKNASVGGDTIVCGAIYNAPDKTLQEKETMSDSVKNTIEKALSEKPLNKQHEELIQAVKKEYDEYLEKGSKGLFDSKQWYALQTWINGDKVANLDLVKKMCYSSEDGLAWLKKLGMKFKDGISQGAGSLWQRTHTSTMKMGTGFISTYVSNLEKNADKVKILTETTALELIKKDDRVVGVKVKDRNGNEYNVNANKGVIITSGGFAANGKMVQEYNTTGKWQDLSKVATTNRFSSSQGDGIQMALKAGAALSDMEQIQLLYLGNTKDGQLTKLPARNINGTDQIIFVNKEGKRFVREDGRRDEICLNVFKQKDSMFYIVESADGKGYVDLSSPDWRSSDGFKLDYLEKNGYVIKADTLEQLAEKIGADPNILKTTVENFNKAIDEGKDEFGRTLFATKLEKGPWVATPRQACIHHTMGGIKIDEDTRVLDTNSKPIKGLYAAGETTGGIHGANRLGGNAVVDTVVFGMLAGQQVVEDNK